MPSTGQIVAAGAGTAVAGAAAAAGGGRAQQQRQGGGVLSMIRMMMMWYFISNMFSKKAPKDPAAYVRNAWKKGEDIDLWVYLSESETFNNFRDESALLWYESNVPFASFDAHSSRSLTLSYSPSKAVQNNGTLFAHIFVARSGYSPNPRDPTFEPASTFGRAHPLVVYHPPPKVHNRKSLLTAEGDKINSTSAETVKVEPIEEKVEVKLNGEVLLEERRDGENGGGVEEGEVGGAGEDEGEKEVVKFVSYLKPNLTLYMVEDFSKYERNKIPEIIHPYFLIDPSSGNYYPFLVPCDFWLLKDKHILLNETVESVDLSLSLSSVKSWKWQFFLSLEQSFKMQKAWGTVDGESDEIKRVFLEGNPVLLAVTMVVSLFHTVFDFLAFKNDIQFWNQNKSMEGLSARSVVLNFVCQLIILLYLFDNETSWLIIISSAIGCCIEFWKIGKAMHVEIDLSGRIPMLRFRDRDSYANNKTKEYDEMASRYLSYALYPLVIGYAIYSLVYETHKSWYSWVVSSLTGCVYTFGFIMMCPQLFINYKLKSVAHLPWRQMTYKFLNTIIDDLFAFVIKMPILHRLSVFRDDVVFLIYLYQRWIYPVDKSRVNEFGFSEKDKEAAELAKKQGKAIKDKTEGEQQPLVAVTGLPEGEEQGEGVSAKPETEAEGRSEESAIPAVGSSLVESRATERSVSEQGLSRRKGGKKGGKAGGEEGEG